MKRFVSLLLIFAMLLPTLTVFASAAETKIQAAIVETIAVTVPETTVTEVTTEVTTETTEEAVAETTVETTAAETTIVETTATETVAVTEEVVVTETTTETTIATEEATVPETTTAETVPETTEATLIGETDKGIGETGSISEEEFVVFDDTVSNQVYDAIVAGSGKEVLEGGKRDMAWPVPGNYGLSGCFLDARDHYAIDIPANRGTNVVACYDGTVVGYYNKCTHNGKKEYRCCNDGFGNYVIIEHEYKKRDGSSVYLYSRYSHLTDVAVTSGTISKGTKIGTIGSTGYSGGFHLDFQILANYNSNYQKLTASQLQDRKSYSIDPYKNELLELPSEISPASTKECCGVGPTGCCCYLYLQEIKEIYAVPLSYLDYCDEFPSYGKIKITKSTTVKTLPCSKGTDAESKDLETASNGTYIALALILNDRDNYWYRVKSKQTGEDAYIYAGDTTWVEQYKNDTTIENVSAPTTLTKGSVFSLKGNIAATYNSLYSVSALVYPGTSTSGTASTGTIVGVTVPTHSYSLSGSKLDNEARFNDLAAGKYTYVVNATLVSYYSNDGKTKVEAPIVGINLHKSQFTVTDNSGCSHSYTAKTTAATCTTDGKTVYTCSKCNDSYQEKIPAKGHTEVKVAGKAATCTATGLTDGKKCSVCGTVTVKQETIAIKSHTEVIVAGKAATCTATGLTDGKKCSVCGTVTVKQETIKTIDHNYDSQKIAATCVEGAKIKYTCKTCGHSYTESTGGTWTEWSTTKPTGVDESLIESRTEYRYRDKIYTTASSNTMSGWTLYNTTTRWSDYGSWSGWSDTAVTASDSQKVETRTVYGYYYYECSSCGAHMHGYGSCYTWAGGCGAKTTNSGWHQIYHPTSWDNAGLKDWHGTGKYYTYLDGELVFKWSSGGSKTQYRYCTRAQENVYHFYQWSNWSDWNTTAVTATDDKKVETRTVYRYSEVEFGDHNYVSKVTAPTCSKKGYTTYTCSVCGDSYQNNYTNVTDHSYGSWMQTKSPTCNASGSERRDCKTCDHYETRTVEATGHTEVTVNGKSATCTATGLTDGKKCSACGTVTVKQQTITAKGHTEVRVASKAATCTESGLSDGKKCSACGTVTVKQQTIAAKGHTEVKVTGKAATCTATGLTDGKKCSACGTVTVKQQTIAAKGHTEVKVTGKAATCTATGLTDGKKCSACGTVTVKQQTIAAKGHTEVTVVGKAATCTETGLTDGKKCSACGTVTAKQQTIAAKGHTEVTVVGKAATCTESGLSDGKKCSTCGAVTVKQQTIASKGHTEVTVAGKAATCTESGLTEGKVCSTCGAVIIEQDTVNAVGHDYVNEVCTVCGESKKVIADTETTPMYRLYNPNSGEHHFTGSTDERDNLVSVGWQYEGIGWYAPICEGEPVYRAYNPNSGDHHYTMSWEEVNNLVNAGWKYEGVAWNSAGPDKTPQYRMYNPNADLGSHHYTSSTEERDFLVSLGWHWEGIGWFGYDAK